jgi:hypothetical protein
MDIEKAIEVIVDEIPSGLMFDSHFVVNQLIENHSDGYLRFAAQYASGDAPTLTTHQMIGHKIKELNGASVQRQETDSWSLNIHHTPGKCALWLKL